MSEPTRHEMSRTEAWLRNHEEWPVPNDDLRAKVMRTASSAQVQAQDEAKEKHRSQWILVMCVLFCGAITWFMQDMAGAIEDPQSSTLLAVAEEGWLRPIDQQVSYIAATAPRTGYDWALVQAHMAWRRLVLHRISAAIWQ